jgi:hypothetical protein
VIARALSGDAVSISFRPGRTTPPRGLVGRKNRGRLAPRGGMTRVNSVIRAGRGTRVAGVGFRVGISVGVAGSAMVAPGPGLARLRSLPAKQHTPKAHPLPATDCGRRPTGWPWSRSSAIEAGGRAVPSRLTLGQRCRSCTTSPRAILVASIPGETSHGRCLASVRLHLGQPALARMARSCQLA